MATLKFIFSLAPIILASHCFAESLYLTSSAPLPPNDDRFVFIAPYFPELKTKIDVSISRGAWNKDLPSAACTPACTKDGKPSGDEIGILACNNGGQPKGVDGTITCVGGKSNSVPFCAPLPPSNDKEPPNDKVAASVGKKTCVPVSSGNYGPPVLSISVSPVPVARGFLYFTKNPFFNDAANVSIGSDGLLSNSDSSSTQQITAILTELAQTAATVAGGRLNGFLPENGVSDSPRKDQRQQDKDKCLKVINDISYGIPFYNTHDITVSERQLYPIYCKDCRSKDNSTSIILKIDTPRGVSSDEKVILSGEAFYGLVAYYPVPARVTLNCRVGGRNSIELTPPQVINLYTESHLVDPQRDFFSNPQDTYTFSSGIITGHKYAAQSPAKNIVDTVTAPVRALMPSVTVTTNTSVQTGGGKPDQTTTSTNTQTAPPKGP